MAVQFICTAIFYAELDDCGKVCVEVNSIAYGEDLLKKIVCVFIMLIVVLTGCSQSKALIKETDSHKLNQKVKSFVDRNKSKNGLYLYSVAGKEEYFIVNYSTAEQGVKVKFLAGIRAEIRDDVFTILMDVQETSDTQDKRIKPLSIYKLNKHEEASKIQVKINGQETPIDIVGS
ncbi:hypothetical protein [Paenibacillus sp. JDR-2]|uniref:hypothetical protein n=1 Tax=Paenibacillus sp. (strain JDR-2) TaxID=324057 RepID=UPI000166A43B|nr:hypothetical protein [Paenibacillus sp. JDR-2]ACT00466.1 hypothetical protein Pjdr2_1805 [Paenibacillus sp. JDR-2]